VVAALRRQAVRAKLIGHNKLAYIYIYSRAFQTVRGLPQGSVISPLLYDFYVRLQQTGAGVQFMDMTISNLAFADDVTLIAGNEADMTTLLAVLDQHSQEFGYSINVAKSAVMWVRPSLRFKFKFKFNSKYIHTGHRTAAPELALLSEGRAPENIYILSTDSTSGKQPAPSVIT
jgi:hypothetical protein